MKEAQRQSQEHVVQITMRNKEIALQMEMFDQGSMKNIHVWINRLMNMSQTLETKYVNNQVLLQEIEGKMTRMEIKLSEIKVHVHA